MYQLLKQEGRARRGEFTTVHGTVQTPAFMNVATSAAIKGGISSLDLRELRCSPPSSRMTLSPGRMCRW